MEGRRSHNQVQLRQRQFSVAEQKQRWKLELEEKRKRGQSLNKEPPVKTLSRSKRKDEDEDSDMENDLNSNNNNWFNNRNRSHTSGKQTEIVGVSGRDNNSPVNAVVKSNWPVNAVVKSNFPPNAVVKSNPPINAVVKSDWPVNAVVKSNWPVNAVVKSDWPINAVVKSSTPPNSWRNLKKSLSSVNPGDVSTTAFNNPSHAALKHSSSNFSNSLSSNQKEMSSQPPPTLPKKSFPPRDSFGRLQRASGVTSVTGSYEEHSQDPVDVGYPSSEDGYEEDNGGYQSSNYDDEDDVSVCLFVPKLKPTSKWISMKTGSHAGSKTNRNKAAYVPPAPPMPTDFTRRSTSAVSQCDTETEEVEVRPKKMKPPDDAERHPRVSLSVLKTVKLRKTENKYLTGDDEKKEDETSAGEEVPEGGREVVVPAASKEEAVVAELKDTVEPDAPASVMKEKVVLKQKKKEEEHLKVDITPEGMLETIPLVDAQGTPIPSWRRQMMARKAAQKAAAEQLEQKIKELELMKLPAWKRHQVETKKN